MTLVSYLGDGKIDGFVTLRMYIFPSGANYTLYCWPVYMVNKLPKSPTRARPIR
jgi:hypothetical protein